MIDLVIIIESILCVPNDLDDARLLSTVAGDKVDEVFIGSCMTNIGHFRAVGKILEFFSGMLLICFWIVPFIKMDEFSLNDEGYYGIFGSVGHGRRCPVVHCAWAIKLESPSVARSFQRVLVISRTVLARELMFTLHPQNLQ